MSNPEYIKFRGAIYKKADDDPKMQQLADMLGKHVNTINKQQQKSTDPRRFETEQLLRAVMDAFNSLSEVSDELKYFFSLDPSDPEIAALKNAVHIMVKFENKLDALLR
jgi:hypothetical protein